MDQVFLLPGDSVTTRKPMRLATLLGSCVSVCLSNTLRGTAGMNHYMLPEAPGTSDLGRYGDTSIRRMLKALLSLDSDPHHYRARVYGGASVIGHLGPYGDIGQRNIEIARRVLSELSIGILHEEVGGNRGRRLAFDTQTGIIDCQTVGVSAAMRAKSAVPAPGVRVLIVDDSAVSRRLLRRGLESCEGITVVGEAKSAFEARDQVLSLDPDVLSLDVEMPQLARVSFLRQLMKHLSKPVVLMSSLATPGSELEARARAAGAFVIDKGRLAAASGEDGVRSVLAPALRRAARSRRGK